MKKIIPLLLALCFTSWITASQVHAESFCTGVPVSGNYTVSTNDALGCYIATPGSINGVDDAGSSEESTTNTAKLVVPEGKSFTIPSGISSNSPTTLVVGSLEIQDGGSVSIGSDFSQIKIGVPLYMLDADSDGRPDSLDFYDATASGRRRRSLAADMSQSDCNPNNATKWKTYSGYVDKDGDGYGVGSINTNICSGSIIDTNYVADNNTDCNDDNASIYRGVAGYIDADGDGYGTGTYKTCVGDASAYVANNTDCNDTYAAATGKNAFGTICTTTDYGTGDDGAVTFSGSQNINTYVNTGRTYADGISYSVSALSTNTITASSTNGIAYGDEVMLINLQGSSSSYSSAGNYENFYVTGVNGNVITVLGNITKTYGVGSNSNLTGQKIIVQRVPNYSNVTVSSGATLTANAWDGTKGGVLAFKASGTATITGSITMTGKGYRGGGNTRQGGEAFCGYNAGAGGPYHQVGIAGSCGGGGGGGGITSASPGCIGSAGGAGVSVGGGGGGGGSNWWECCGGSTGAAGGGGYGTAGTGGGGTYSGTNGGTNTSGAGGQGHYTNPSNCRDGTAHGGGGGGGGTYGDSNLTQLFMGSAGAQGGGAYTNSGTGYLGGTGGGIIAINAKSLSLSGTIQNNGTNGESAGANGGGCGGGAGGSVYIKTDTETAITNITITGGTGGTGYGGHVGGTGGSGRKLVVQ
ncbi:MAG TPA: hypothetical protein VLH94_00415 [Spirochaetia bacterium]|nr:hypothetical protein [Spirochaetia bacterium]